MTQTTTLPQINAAAAYAETQATIRKALAEIAEQADAHSRATSAAGANWAHVGDMRSLASHLEQIASALRNGEVA